MNPARRLPSKKLQDADSDSSGVSFQPGSDGDESDNSMVSTDDLTFPDPPRPQSDRSRHSNRPQLHVRRLASPEGLPDFSDDPDDDTDEDLNKIPLDYGRSEKTKVKRESMKQRWHKFCRVKASEPDALPKWNDPEDALRQHTPSDVHRFLNYRLKLKTGKGGRRLKRIKKASALKAEWKCFSGYYRNITRAKISSEDSEEIHAGIRKLIVKWDLDEQERGKEPVYVQDLTKFNETVIRTQEKRFNLGFERIQLCLFNMIGIYTVNRLGALLSLQFKHLQVSIQKDPLGGPPIPLVEIRSEHTKQFLGTSQINNFPLPEIIDDPSLIFSPHVFLFGVFFWLKAFDPSTLDSMERLRELLVEGGRQQMELPFKPEFDDCYLFCKVAVMDGEVVPQWKIPMKESTMSGRLTSLGEIHGWLHSMFAHRFRYGGGKMLNESGAVSEAQQNLIMKHTDMRTFLNHYLPRNIDTDMQNIMNGRESNTALMRAITRMSRWIDKRRPRHITHEQRMSIRENTEYLEAIKRRDEQAKACEHNSDTQMLLRLAKLTRDVTNTSNRLARNLKKKTRKEFDRKQAVIDIERQLSGSAVDDEEAKEVLRTQEQMLPEQINLIQKLFTWPTSQSLDSEWKRRNTASEAIAQYCSVLEGGPLRGRPPKRSSPSGGFDNEQQAVKRHLSNETSQLSTRPEREILLEEFDEHTRKAAKPKAARPRRCFQCCGNMKLPDHRRTQEWSEPKSTVRHFRKRHLNDRKCNMCEIDLLHEMHLRRHAQDVHRLCV